MVLSEALSAAGRQNLILRNPAGTVSKPSLVRHDERRALTEAEIELLVAGIAGTRFDVPTRLTLATGLRQGELLSLKWPDVDLADGVINVRGTKTANSKRQVELSAAMVKLLRAHKLRQRESLLKRGPSTPSDNLVFPCSTGEPWNRRIFYRDYKTLVGRSGIEHPESITWHTLRHTAATQWIRHGADIFTVSRRLGHASGILHDGPLRPHASRAAARGC